MPRTNYYDRYNAQDYGRGYSGRSNYYQGYTPQGIVSMFDPGSMDMIAQAASSRQQRFDAGSTAIAQERARIAGMETLDPVNAAKELRAFEEKLNEKVQGTYGGDYGAAVNSITNLIGAERSNPFYKFNTAQLKAADLEDKARMAMGADYMAAKSPRDISFEDYKKGQTDFSFTPVNRQTIVKRSAEVFGQYAKQLMNVSGYRSTEEGKFLERVLDYGFKDKAGMEDFLNKNPEIVEGIMNTPGLEGLDQKAVYEAIVEGAHAGIGHSQIDVKGDPSYLNPLEQARMAGLQGTGDLTGGLSFTAKSKIPMTKQELHESYDESPEITNHITQLAQKHGLNISSYSDAEKARKAIKRMRVSEDILSLFPGSTKTISPEAMSGVLNTLTGIGNMMIRNPSLEPEGRYKVADMKSGNTPLHKFIEELEEYTKTLDNTKAVNMYQVDRFMTTLDSKQRTAAKDSREVLDEEVGRFLKTSKEGFFPTSGKSKDADELQKWLNVKVTDIGFDSKGRLYINVYGGPKKGEEEEKQIEIKDFTMASNLAKFYGNIELRSGSKDATWRNYYKSLYNYAATQQPQ